jgi:hypothetical protein
MEMQMPAKVDEVVAAEIEDKPGSLADLLVHLYDTDVSVIYSYAFVGISEGNAVMIFRFNDNEKAIHILKAKGVKLLSAKAFGIGEADT